VFHCAYLWFVLSDHCCISQVCDENRWRCLCPCRWDPIHDKAA
jgi:hypothetical protein